MLKHRPTGAPFSRAIVLLVAPLAAPLIAQGGQLDTTGVSDTFSRLYPARAKTFVKASADPDDRPTSRYHGNDDGFTGANQVEAYREFVQPDEFAVLVDIEGRSGFMGCFFRNFWSGLFGVPVDPIEENRTRIVVDGAIVHDMPLSDFFRSPFDPRGQVAPFAGFFTGNRAGGHLTHTPITWQNRFQIRVFENSFANAARFHKVCGALASPEQLLQAPNLAEWERVAAANGGWPHKSNRIPVTRRLTIPADGGVRLIRLSGPATILELRCKVRSPAEFADLIGRFTWDDLPRPSVEVPVRMLGGAVRPPYGVGLNSVLFNNNGIDTVTCYFPMHFASKAQLEFWNQGPQEIQLDLTYALATGDHPQPWGHFTASFHGGITRSGETFEGPRLTDVRGMLRALVLETSMNTSGNIPGLDLQHLEGDLCVRINQNRGDDHTFAATETSIGKWGWYLSPSDVPFVADSSFNSGIQLRTRPDGYLETDRMMGSTFIFDPIHFVDGIDLRLEHGVQNRSNADYGLMSVFYVQQGAAREQVLEIDVGDATSEAAAGVQFGTANPFDLTSEFFRDRFFGTPALSDDGREVADWYRFTVTVPANTSYHGFCVAFRLDRERIGFGGICQADVLVDGQAAGLLHGSTSNALARWKEGGELEVELPRALTDGRRSFVVEVRPRATTLPFRAGNIKVFGYTND